MNTYDYKAKIIEFTEEIKRIVSQKSAHQETQRLISLIHKILFYAEQYFIEQELKFRNNAEQALIIKRERQDVIQRLQSFADSIKNYNSELNRMINFLESWKYKLNSESQYA